MRKIIALILAAMMLLSVAGCANQPVKESQPESSSPAESSETAEPEAEPEAEPSKNEKLGEKMLGEWAEIANPRVKMDVQRNGEKFEATITWSNSATEAYQWRMSGSFEDVENGRITADECSKYEVTFNTDGSTSEKVLYAEGTAKITLVNGILYWHDAQEDRGEELMFVRPWEVQTESEPDEEPSSSSQASSSQASSSKPASSSSQASSSKPASSSSKPASSSSTAPKHTNGKHMVGEYITRDNSRVYMIIEEYYGKYYVTISWANNAYDYYEWRMVGRFEDIEDGRIASSDVHCYRINYDSYGYEESELIYNGSYGHITKVGNYLYWYDDVDDSGEGYLFEEGYYHSGNNSHDHGIIYYDEGEDMLGDWYVYDNSRVSLSIEDSYDDLFYITITWRDSAYQTYEWRMSGEWEDVEDGRISCTNAKCYLITFDEYGFEEEELLYRGGYGRVTLIGDYLYWYDGMEDAGADLIFEQ